jgi:hypothetical protein
MEIQYESEAYLTTTPQKVRERPKQYMDTLNPISPNRITGFLPIRSERDDQWRTVMA